MTTMPADLAFQRSLIRILRNDAAIAALVGRAGFTDAPVKVFDTLPGTGWPDARIEAPYVTLGPSEMTPFFLGCETATQVTAQIDVWSTDPGRAELRRIAARIAMVLGFDDRDPPPPLDGDQHSLVSIRVDRIAYLDEPDGVTRHAAITVTAILTQGL